MKAIDITAQIGAIASTIPGARLEIIPSTLYLSCIERPGIFNRLVANFPKD